MNKKKTILLSIGILVVAAIVTFFIFVTEPEASRSGATKTTAMLVDVADVAEGNFNPTLIATGTVQPSKEIILSPRVNGEVIRRGQNFIPGGIVKKGQLLLQLDPSDYRNTLELRKSELSQAQADLNIEEGRQAVAEKDYQLVEESLSDENMQLVLRQPQLNAVKARVAAAEAAVNQANLQLNRTTIYAPFDAQVITRNVNVGSQVAPGDNLARLVGTDAYWVVVSLPLSKLSRLSFPMEEDEMGSEVIIRDRKAWKDGEQRMGYLYKMIGALESQTRMARVLVIVPDPLGADDPEKPKLVINSFVEAEIEGDQLQDVIRLNRDYLRENETVWVKKNDKLDIRNVDIIFQDAKYAYIRKGLNGGDSIVTTNLATVTEGAPLKINEEKTEVKPTGSQAQL